MLSDDPLQALQREVQRLLGKCLLRVQQYEHLIKAVIAHHEISGSAQALKTVQAARLAETAGKTLGTLVGDLVGSYIVTDEIGALIEATTCSSEDVISFSMRRSLSDADFAQTKSELRELVLLRNNLVHHFIDRYDLSSLDGCSIAQDALEAAYSRIDQEFERLRGWTEDISQLRGQVAEVVQSDWFRELVVNGIYLDGTVFWPSAGIVSALVEVAHELGVDGWAPIAEAGKLIAERHPEQLPAKYGCNSWRQVVHESSIFEIRYREIDGQSAAWFREKEISTNSR